MTVTNDDGEQVEDPHHASDELGTPQEDTIARHHHFLARHHTDGEVQSQATRSEEALLYAEGRSTPNTSNYGLSGVLPESSLNKSSSWVYSSSDTGDAETRPINKAVHFIIRVK